MRVKSACCPRRSKLSEGTEPISNWARSLQCVVPFVVEVHKGVESDDIALRAEAEVS